MDRLEGQRGAQAMGRGLVGTVTSLIATGLLLAPTARGEEPWFTRFEQGRAQTNAACHEKKYEACAQGLRTLLPLVDGRPDIQCVLAGAQAQLGERQASAQSLRI